MGDTTIAWTDKVWNPVTGCTKVSAGCKHCYAERVFPRAYGRLMDKADPMIVLREGRKFTDVLTHPERLDQPLRWRKPQRIFVNSMSDLFHEAVPAKFIDRVFAVAALCPYHTFQILTKRPETMLEYLSAPQTRDGVIECAGHILHERQRVDIRAMSWDLPPWPLPNVWLGVSVENQETWNERKPLLVQTPAAVRFISYEPALEAIGDMDLSGIDWVIVGGESGPKARPFDLAWVRSAIAQCKAAGVPCFVKQLGGWPDKRDNPADWPEDVRVQQFPDSAAREG